MNGKERRNTCSDHRNHLIRDNQTPAIQKNHAEMATQARGWGGVIVGFLTSFFWIPQGCVMFDLDGRSKAITLHSYTATITHWLDHLLAII